MADYINNSAGAPVAFHDDNHIYDLSGRAVGKLRGSRVYCMAGHYIGALANGVIVDKRGQRPEHPRTPCRQRGDQRPLQFIVR